MNTWIGVYLLPVLIKMTPSAPAGEGGQVEGFVRVWKGMDCYFGRVKVWRKEGRGVDSERVWVVGWLGSMGCG